MAGSNRKRQRAKKVSKGIHGATHSKLDTVTKVLLGKGVVQNVKDVAADRPWRGASDFKVPFDAKQASANRKLYPHLFGGRGR